MKENKLVNKELAAADRLERWLPGIVVISAMTGFCVLAWYAYNTNSLPARDEDLLVVEAEKTPIKEKPLDPGGMKFPNQDKTIFETFGAGNQAPPKVERVLPSPEEPMAKEGGKAWVNSKIQESIDTPKIESIPDSPQTAEDKKVAAAIEKFASGKGNVETPPLKKAEPVKQPEPIQEEESVNDSPRPGSWEAVAKNVEEADLAKAPEEPIKLAAKPAEVSKPAPEIPKPVEKPAPKEVASSSGSSKAQLAAFRSEEEAKEAWTKITKKFPETSGHAPIIVKADLGEKGIYYRLRVGGFASTAEVKAFCAALTPRGQACMPAVE